MIDIIVTASGDLVLTHDEKRLDAFDFIFVNAITGDVCLRNQDGNILEIGSLKPSMMEALKESSNGKKIRFQDMKIASITDIDVIIY